MAKTISQVQAEALAEGFFDSVGSNKKDFKPVKSMGKLIVIAGHLAERASENLIKSDRISSGKGAESIKVMNPERVNNSVHIDVTMLYYLQFIDRGVKGTKSGGGEFSFKNDKPGRSMINAITEWVRREKIKAKTNVGGKPITKREAKRKKITDPAKKIAYPIARSVKQHGIKASKFMVNAVKDTRKEVKEEMGKSFKIDIINSLPKKLKDS